MTSKILNILLLLTPSVILHCTSAPTPQEKPKEETKVASVDRKAIIKTIQGHRKYLSHCYGKALTKKGNAKLKGVVYIAFEIGPDGSAKNPQMISEKSSLRSYELNQCLFAGLTSWDFPVHPEGEPLVIHYPFRFRDLPPSNMQNKLDQFEKLRQNP